LSASLTISLDAMGGDHAPEMVIRGADLARLRFPSVHYLLHGDENLIRPVLSRLPALEAVASIRHTEISVKSEDRPSQALRSGRGSSMRLAIDAVAAGEAQAVVSAGNTGALMAMAKFVLKTLPGIDRPAIASILPTIHGECVMLDLGANVDCDANNLVQFAVMGNVFARTVLGIREPSVGILNVGVEEMKGHDAVRMASQILKDAELPGQFVGFVEGDDIAKGTADVVVTDGFTGNVALKTAEGTAKLYSHFLRQSFRSSWVARIGYLLAKSALGALQARVDPRRYNGAIFMGLNGICVKSHGGTDAFGFASAIGVAVDMVANGAIEKMKHDFMQLTSVDGGAESAASL
jgi:glycerol-3-phosphate acyltransferase PlsX